MVAQVAPEPAQSVIEITPVPAAKEQVAAPVSTLATLEEDVNSAIDTAAADPDLTFAGIVRAIKAHRGWVVYVPSLASVLVALYCENVNPIVLYSVHPTARTVYCYSLFHGSALHLASTVFPLIVYGCIVEWEEGTLRTIVIHTYAIWWGAVGSLWEAYILKTPQQVIGASGGMYGLLSSLLGFLLINWRSVGWLKKSLYVLGVVSSTVSDIVIDAAYLKGSAGNGDAIAYGAHLGGFIGGVLAGIAFTRQDLPIKWETPVRIVCGVLATMGLFGLFIKYDPPNDYYA